MSSEPTNDQLRALVEVMLSNLDKEVREREVLDEAIRDHLDTWVMLHQARLDAEALAANRPRGYLVMYEIVLRSPDGTEDIRLTSRDPRGSGYVTVDGLRLKVLSEEPGGDGLEARFIVEPPPVA